MLIRVFFRRLIVIKIVITVIILRDMAKFIDGFIGFFFEIFIVQCFAKIVELLCLSLPEYRSFKIVNSPGKLVYNCTQTDKIIKTIKRIIIIVILTILFTIFGQNT